MTQPLAPQLPDEAPAAANSYAVILRDLLRLTWPVLCEQLLHASVGFCDTWLSGRFGAAATQAVGVSAYLGWLATLTFGLLSTGVAALASRAWGAGQPREAAQAVGQSLMLSFGLGGLMCLVFWWFAPHLAIWLGLEGESLAIARMYLRYDAFGQWISAFLLIGAASFRAIGSMPAALAVMGTASVMNVICSCLLVYGLGPVPALGVEGIAAGTLVARCCAATILAILLIRRTAHLPLHWSDLTFRAGLSLRLLRIGLPAAMDGLLTFAGHFTLVRIVRLSGGALANASFAAHVVGVQFEAISYQPAVALGHAAAVIVGQALGAALPQRARRAGRLAAILAAAYGAVCAAVFYGGAEFIFGRMHIDPDVQRIGVPAFRLIALYQVPNAIQIVFSACLRGAGDTRFPMWNALLGCTVLRPSIAYLAGVTYGGGLWGAWLGMGADNLTRALLVTWRFLAGRWLNVKV